MSARELEIWNVNKFSHEAFPDNPKAVVKSGEPHVAKAEYDELKAFTQVVLIEALGWWDPHLELMIFPTAGNTKLVAALEALAAKGIIKREQIGP